MGINYFVHHEFSVGQVVVLCNVSTSTKPLNAERWVKGRKAVVVRSEKGSTVFSIRFDGEAVDRGTYKARFRPAVPRNTEEGLVYE